MITINLVVLVGLALGHGGSLPILADAQRVVALRENRILHEGTQTGLESTPTPHLRSYDCHHYGSSSSTGLWASHGDYTDCTDEPSFSSELGTGSSSSGSGSLGSGSSGLESSGSDCDEGSTGSTGSEGSDTSSSGSTFGSGSGLFGSSSGSNSSSNSSSGSGSGILGSNSGSGSEVIAPPCNHSEAYYEGETGSNLNALGEIASPCDLTQSQWEEWRKWILTWADWLQGKGDCYYGCDETTPDAT